MKSSSLLGLIVCFCLLITTACSTDKQFSDKTPKYHIRTPTGHHYTNEYRSNSYGGIGFIDSGDGVEIYLNGTYTIKTLYSLR